MGWRPGIICAWSQANRPDATWERAHECMSGSCGDDQKSCSAKKYDAQRRRAEKASYRKFPGNTYQAACQRRFQEARDAKVKDPWEVAHPKGHCRWCSGPIWSAKKPGEVNKQRTWHPNCLRRYYLHTRAENQLIYLIGRDGPGCRGCGKAAGQWRYRRTWVKTEPWGGYHIDTALEVDGPNGPMCEMWWVSSLQVDHAMALGLVVLLIPEAKRWRFWGPTNLQGLCEDCHKAKTREDVAKMKAARLSPPPQALAPGA